MKQDMDSTVEQIIFGSKTIIYSLKHSSRRTLGISVYPDLSVKVVAPFGVEKDIIQKKLDKRAAWIFKKQLYFSDFVKPIREHKFTQGESHWFLGRQYRLTLLGDLEESPKVKRTFGRLLVNSPKDFETVKKTVEGFYREECKKRTLEFVSKWKPKLGIEDSLPKIVSVRKLSKRWGSCTKEGKLIFNWELIKAPTHCVEYVVVHELCHLLEFNHSSRFFRLMDLHLPDWRERKRKLEMAEL